MLLNPVKCQEFSTKTYNKLARKIFLDNPQPPKLVIGMPKGYSMNGGLYVPRTNTIFLHPRLTLRIKETICHEDCHAIAWHWKRCLSHNAIWQLLMKSLGYKPKVKAEDWRLHKGDK